MSGPIVRSAPNKKFTQNWDAVFGGKKSAAKGAASPAAKKKAAKKKK
jgi:hypothetical protein